MGIRLLAVVAAAVLVTAYATAGQHTPTSASTTKPTSRPTDLAEKLVLEIQQVAKIDAPGASGFAGALAGVLKKHSLPVPEALLTAKPAVALPKLSETQLRTYSSQTMTNLLDHISDVGSRVVDPSEGALRVDLLEAFGRHAPSMALRLEAADRRLSGWRKNYSAGGLG